MSILGIFLSKTTPNLLSVTQDSLTIRQSTSSIFAVEWREAEARVLESLVHNTVYMEYRLSPGRILVHT